MKPGSRFFSDPLRLGFSLILILAFFSFFEIEGTGRETNFIKNLLRFLQNFFPPDWSDLSELLQGLRESFAIAILASLISFFLAIPFGVLASKDIAPRFVNDFFRIILNFIRTIPSLLWALIAVAIFGASEFAGLMALSFYSVGYLGKFFADDLDSVEKKNFDSIRYLDANLIVSFRFGIWPQLRALFASHFIWMLEYNVRAASIIGYVGAGGIGAKLYVYQEYYQWDRFCAALILIFIVVSVLDLIGQKIRNRLQNQF